VTRAYDRGIGTLIDFHAVPGGANSNEHSRTNSGLAALWHNKDNLDYAGKCIHFIAEEITREIRGVIGLQVCNEAVSNAHGMYAWYDSFLPSISAINPDVPPYISDAWDLAQAVRYAKSRNKTPSNPPRCHIIIDGHHYFCFSETDKAKSPQDIIASVPSSLDALMGRRAP
jgi:aryl-phospho-beta-D-glucosidase BglC (GH1 family)